MKIHRMKKQRTLVPTTSMGDVAFLLIIFFMVTSNFIKEAHINITRASSADVEKLEESMVSVSVDADGQIWLQGEECDIGSLEGLVRDMMAGRKDNTVMVKVDKNVSHETYGEVMLSLSRAEVEIALVGNRET